MRRNFRKMINEGAQILEDRPGMDMSLQEADALVASAEPGNMRFSFHDAYCAGVAAGVRISKRDARRKLRGENKPSF